MAAGRRSETGSADARLPRRGRRGPHLFLACQNQLLAFLPGDFRPQWKYDINGFIPGSPVIGPDGNIRVHSCDGFLHVVSPAGQRLFDPVRGGEPLGWTLPLADARNNTWICRHDGGLMKVDSAGQTGRRPFLRTRNAIRLGRRYRGRPPLPGR